MQQPTQTGLAIGKALARWGVRLLLAALTVLVLTGVFMAWRVASEPVSLRFAIPAIESALSAADGSFVARLGGFRLRRDGVAFVFEAQDLALLPGDGQGQPVGTPLAVLPIAEISLSLSALVQDGVLAAERVVARGLLVTAQRGGEGIEVLLAGQADPTSSGIRLGGLRRLLQTDLRLRHLKAVDLDRLTFRVVDPLLGIAWQTEGTRMRLVNEPEGFKWEGQVGFSAPHALERRDQAGGTVQWSLTFPPDMARAAGEPEGQAGGIARLAVQLDRLDPAVLLDLMPGLAKAVGWQGLVSGAISTQFAPQGLPSDIRFVLRTGEGRLALPASGGYLDFGNARAVGRLRLADRVLEVDELTVVHPGGLARLRGQAALHGPDEARLQLSASRVHLAWLASLAPGAAALQGADLTVFADIDATLRLDGGLENAAIFVRSDPGQLALPDQLAQPVGLRSGVIDLRVSDGGRSFVLQRLRAAITRQDAADDLVVQGAGQARTGGEGRIDIATTTLTVDDLKRLWPKGVGEAARVWVLEQVQAGRIEPAKTRLTFRLPESEGLPAPTDVRVEARLPVRDLALTYWPPLPDATGVNAEARLTETLFEAVVTSGESAGVRVTGGEVRFSGIDKGKGHERTELSFQVTGPASRLMAILDRPPLGFARFLNMAPAALGGTITGTLTAAFPPIAELALDDIEIGASGETRGLVLPGAAFDQDLTHGQIRFRVDKTRLQLDGQARLAGAVARLEGDVRFPADAPFRSRFRLQGTLDDRARAAIGFAGFPVSPEIVSGPVAIDMTATEQRRGGTLIAVQADLSQARLALAPLGWTSPAGEYAGLTARVRVDDGRLRRLDGFRLTAPQLSIAGDADWTAAGAAAPTVRISEFRLGSDTQVTMLGQPAAGGGFRLSIAGARLDARPLLRRLTEPGTQAAPAAAAAADGARLAVNLSIGSVRLGDGPPLVNLQGAVQLTGGAPQALQLAAHIAGGGQVTAALLPDGVLTLKTNDAGALLEAIGITERVQSGSLRIDAHLTPADKRMSGQLVMRDGVFREAPFLMRLFSGATAAGPGLLRSWSVDQVDTDFAVDGGILTLEDGRVAGGELGATFQGWIDLNREMLDLSGAIVPVYSVNRVLQAIPLIGTVLTGGEGLFAANYRATGRLAEPEFNVNPLTALAPGLLRRLFGGAASAPPGSEGAAAPAEARPEQPIDASPAGDGR